MSILKEDRNYQNISDYSVIDVIGTGSFGTCYKVKHKITNKFYVLKAVDFGSMTVDEKKLLVTEVNLMDALKHPNIVEYYGRIVHKSSGTLYIIMEWCERGDLDALINHCKSNNLLISEKFIWKVLYQTARALEACHSLRNRVTVLHRDIKPANIFLDKNYDIKLGDFGLAKILKNNVNFSNTLVGTPYYMSPEQIQGSKYNQKIDVWSLGCLIFELCCLSQPFTGNNINELKGNISLNKLPRIPVFYSDYLDKMVRLLLKSNFEFRPSVKIIIHHPTVICNFYKNATPFAKDDTRHSGNGGKSVPRTEHQRMNINSENNVDFITRVGNLSEEIHNLSINSDPKAISENVYNKKLMTRLKLLREKESVLKARENSLKTKEYLLKTKENSLVLKQMQIEKREREIAASQSNGLKSEGGMNKYTDELKNEIIKHIYANDLDSTTCSADPGDTSVLPTAVKLDPAKIVKPSFFKSNQNYVNTNKQNIKKRVSSLKYGMKKFDTNVNNFETVKKTSERQPFTLLGNYPQSQMARKTKNILEKKHQNSICTK